MGKKRIVKKKGQGMDSGLRNRSLSRISKKKMDSGTLHIHATYNNTKLMLADKNGGSAVFSSSGSLGFGRAHV